MLAPIANTFKRIQRYGARFVVVDPCKRVPVQVRPSGDVPVDQHLLRRALMGYPAMRKDHDRVCPRQRQVGVAKWATLNSRALRLIY